MLEKQGNTWKKPSFKNTGRVRTGVLLMGKDFYIWLHTFPHCLQLDSWRLCILFTSVYDKGHNRGKNEPSGETQHGIILSSYRTSTFPLRGDNGFLIPPAKCEAQCHLSEQLDVACLFLHARHFHGNSQYYQHEDKDVDKMNEMQIQTEAKTDHINM